MESNREHLTRDECDGYIQRTLPPPDLLAVDDHLDHCRECMSMIDRINSSVSGSSLVTDILETTELDHLRYEQIASYVDGRSDDVDNSIVELHLKDCDTCREEVDAITSIRERLVHAKPDEQPERSKTDWFNRKLLFPAFGILLLGAALYLGLPAIFVEPGSSTSAGPAEVAIPDIKAPEGLDSDLDIRPEPADPGIVASVRDGDSIIGVRSDGSLTGLDGASAQIAQAVRSALETGNISIGERIAVGNTGTLMSGDRDGVPFGLIGPVGRVVVSQRPVFSWKPLSGADLYSVRIFDESFAEVMSGSEVRSTTWTPLKPLQRGRAYLWQVTARKGDETVISPVRPAPDARFRIVDAEAAEQIDLAEKHHPRSNLIRGLAYARAGMLADAEREFTALVRKNPGSSQAQRLLQQVRKSR